MSCINTSLWIIISSSKTGTISLNYHIQPPSTRHGSWLLARQRVTQPTNTKHILHQIVPAPCFMHDVHSAWWQWWAISGVIQHQNTGIYTDYNPFARSHLSDLSFNQQMVIVMDLIFSVMTLTYMGHIQAGCMQLVRLQSPHIRVKSGHGHVIRKDSHCGNYY